MIGYFPLPRQNSPWCGKVPCGATHPAKAAVSHPAYPSELGADRAITGWGVVVTLLVWTLLYVVFRRR